MSLPQAVKHIPKPKTYGLRISSEFDFLDIMPLEKSENWVGIFEYHFDDIWPKCPGRVSPKEVMFNDELAQKVLSDFREHKDQVDRLLVHCYAGQSRSPAVAIALNEIFNLGYDSEEMKEEYPGYNQFVYEMLLRNSK